MTHRITLKQIANDKLEKGCFEKISLKSECDGVSERIVIQ